MEVPAEELQGGERKPADVPDVPDVPDVVGGISCSIPDASREDFSRWDWEPGRRLLRSIRLYAEACRTGGALGAAMRKYAAAQHRFWSAVTGADIPITTDIGLGLLVPHPNGIVIHPDVKIGPNCLIFQQVTLGTSSPTSGVPRLGGHVDIGAGAKILGGITLGHHARIGANAVVLIDVPPCGVAMGVPATLRKTS